jgi:spectrin beta
VEQTVRWINEKSALIEGSDPNGKDLETVLKEQRQLQAIERDLVALADKIETLNKQADQLSGQHPDKADVIRDRVDELNRLWTNLNDEMQRRRAQLGESGSLQAYILDLMAFQTWLSDALARASSQELPNSAAHAEDMLKEHQELKTETNTYDPTYNKIVENGQRIITDPSDAKQQEAQKLLSDVEASWAKLLDTWENRQEQLVQCLSYQTFKRDAEHAEVLLGEEDKYLADENLGDTLDEAERLLKKHEEFEKKLAAHDDNVNTLQMLAERLIEDEHFASIEMAKTAKDVDDKRNENRQRATKRKQALEDSLRLHRFRRDCDELEVWIAEKMQTACDESYRDPTNLVSKQKRHEAFEAELDANRQQLDDLLETGNSLAAAQPESSEEIKGRLDDLQSQWEELRGKAAERGLRLRQGNSQEQFSRAVEDLVSWLDKTESSLLNDDLGKDIPSVGNLLKKHQLLEVEVAAQKQEVEKLCSEADKMVGENHFDGPAVKETRDNLEQRYASIADPMTRRRSRLEASKKLHHFNRDVDEELAWIKEKMVLAQSTDYGNDYLATQRLLKRHKALVAEVGGHEPIITSVCETADHLVSEGHEESEQIKARKTELQERWTELNDCVAGRQELLEQSAVAQQYFLDAAEAEAWMSEQELYMIEDDRGRDEASASALLKKHHQLQAAVTDYKKTVEELAGNAKRMKEQNNPSSDAVQITQSRVNKLYAGLEDLAKERAKNLDESYKLFQLNREVAELESWINDKEVVAQSKELGQDFEHCEMIQEKFQEFARNSLATGTDRYDSVNSLADSLIDSGHTEAVTIKEWKDGVGDSWNGLKEMIDARRKALATAFEMKRFYRDSNDMKARIQEKMTAMPEDLGDNVAGVETLLRNHDNFERDATAIGTQLTALSKEAARLQQDYPDDPAIGEKQQSVEDAWETLQERTADRKLQLKASDDLQKFLAAVKALLVWTGDMRMNIFADDPARDVRQAEMLIKQHQSRRSEIENREADFDAIARFGQDLVDRSHFASKEITAKLQLLVNERNELWSDWNGREDELRLFLEVHLFARDSHMADQWLSRLEQFLTIEELGDSLDDVDAYLKKHDDLIKSLDAQEERFNMLTKATEFEDRQREFERDRVFSVTGAGELSNRQPVAAGYIAERIEKIELEARASPVIQKKMEELQTELEREKSPPVVTENFPEESEVEESHRVSMIIHADVPADRSSGPLMSEEIERALDRELAVTSLSSDEEVHAKADAFVSSVIRDAGKGGESENVVTKAEMPSEVSNALEVEHKPNRHEGKQVVHSSAEMPFIQDFKLQPVTTITLRAHCPSDATRFWFRLMADEDNIALEIMPVFQDNIVVLSAKVDGRSTDEKRCEPFPFVRGSEFELKVVVDEDEYQVSANGTAIGSFQSPHPLSIVTKLLIGGDPDGTGSIVLLGLNAKVKKRTSKKLPVPVSDNSASDNSASQPVSSASPVAQPESSTSPVPPPDDSTSPPPQPNVRRSVEDEAFRDSTTPETPREGRMAKHVSFSDDVALEGREDKSVSPLPELDGDGKEQPAAGYKPAGGIMEGILIRKHEMESAGKKSHARSWKSFYVVLKDNQLIFYKDERDAVHSHHGGAPPISLEGSQCAEASDYTKRKHCLRLKTSNGGEWLFQAKNADVMKTWIRAIDQSTQLFVGEERPASPDVTVESTVAASSSSADNTPLQSPSHVPTDKSKAATEPQAAAAEGEPRKEKKRSIFGRKK